MALREMSKMNKIVFIRARLGSERFPGKVLENVGYTPALLFMVNRIRRACLIDNIVILTTKLKEDKKIIDICTDYGITVFNDNEDVLQKTCNAAAWNMADVIVDLTGDCPFIDPKEIDKLILKLFFFDCDYVSNIDPRTLPRGFDIQVYKSSILQEVNKLVKDKAYRTHSGWNILNNRTRLPRAKFRGHKVRKKYIHPDWRVTLDYKEDLRLLNEIWMQFKDDNFSQWDIVRCLNKNKNLLEINKNCRQKKPDEI